MSDVHVRGDIDGPHGTLIDACQTCMVAWPCDHEESD